MSHEREATSRGTGRPADDHDDGQDQKGVKRSAPDSTSDLAHKVHSANEWEKAYVGDDDRKNKFLKLMGASKKQHHGRFVIGDNESVKGVKADTSGELVVGLEQQFQNSMDHKLQSGWRGHLGLGFTKEEKVEEKVDTKPADTEPSSEHGETADKDKQENEPESKEESENREEPASVSSSTVQTSAPSVKNKYKTMSFVKSSS